MCNYSLDDLNVVVFNDDEVKKSLAKLKSGSIKKNSVAPIDSVLLDHYEIRQSLTAKAEIKNWAKKKLNLIRVDNGSISVRNSIKKNAVVASLIGVDKLTKEIPIINSIVSKMVELLKRKAKIHFNEKEWDDYKHLVINATNSSDSLNIAKATAYVTCHSADSIRETVKNISSNMNILTVEQLGVYQASSNVFSNVMAAKENENRSQVLEDALNDLIACGQREFVLVNDIIHDYDQLVTLVLTLRDAINLNIKRCNENQDFISMYENSKS